ncbi:MAG: TolC family protein [Sphaerochaeta sp.]|nr:TolC family protein [Sphaerochaeta sp.]
MHHRLASLLVLLCILSPLGAQSMSLAEAIKQAKAYNTDAQNAAITLSQNLNEAQVNEYLPSIKLSAGASAQASLLDASYSASISPNATLSFSLSSANRYTNEQQSLSAQSARSNYASTMQQIEQAVTTAYWNVVAAELSLQMQQLEVSHKQENLEQMRSQYEGGEITTLTVSQAELSLADALLGESSRERVLEEAKDQLSLLTGSAVVGKLDDLLPIGELKSLDALLALASSTTTIKTAELSVEQAKLAYLQTQASSASPVLALDASTTFSAQLSTSGSSLRDSTTVGVTVSIPVDAYLKNSKTNITLKNLASDIEVAENRLMASKKALASSISSAYHSIEEAKKTIDYLSAYELLAQQSADLSQIAYNAGEISYRELAESQKSLSQAHLSLLVQQVNHTLLIHKLANLLQVPTTTLSKES